MVFRSCICTKRYPIIRLALYKKALGSLKYPGIHYHYPRQSRTITNSVQAITNKVEKLDLKSNHQFELDSVLNKQYSLKQAKNFYKRLCKASPKHLAYLFKHKLLSLDYDTQLRQTFLDASAYWTIPTAQAVMKEWGLELIQLQLDLFTQNLLQKYSVSRDITPILQALPTKGKMTDLMLFYNATLSRCQREKEYKHVRLVIERMKQNDISFDTASYNVLLRMTLMEDRTLSGMDTYHKFLEQGAVPNQATFNILIKHTAQQKQWHLLKQWLDLMEEDSLEPTQVTARILFRALSKYPLNKDIGQAYDRVANALPSLQVEPLVNTSVAALLEEQQYDRAIDVLKQAFESNEPLSAYAYNLLLKALCGKGEIGNAKRILDQIPKPDIVSFTTILHGIVRHSEKVDEKQIAALYRQLTERGLQSNNVLQSVVLYGFMKSNNLEKTRALFDTILKTKNQVRTPLQKGNKALIDMDIYNLMIDFYFLHHHKSKGHTMPKEPFDLLNQAMFTEKLKPTTVTLNIMVRGLAILNKDLNAAEKMVDLLNVDVDERTIWYMTKAAYRQGEYNRARAWIKYYEDLGQTIQGTGLNTLKSIVTKWEDNKHV